jgi:hypothetical protein
MLANLRDKSVAAGNRCLSGPRVSFQSGGNDQQKPPVQRTCTILASRCTRIRSKPLPVSRWSQYVVVGPWMAQRISRAAVLLNMESTGSASWTSGVEQSRIAGGRSRVCCRCEGMANALAWSWSAPRSASA